MSKKLITACLGVLALAAFALPANALAVSATLTHPTGTALNPVGQKCTTLENAVCLTATNVGKTLLKSDDGSTTLSECTKATLTGSLIKNKEGHIEANIHTATFSGDGAEFDGMKECLGLGGLGNLTPTTNGTDPVNTKIDGEDVEHGTPWCLTAGGDLPANTFTVRGGTCSESARTITFILNSTGAGECKMTRTAAITGTYTTHSTGDAILTVAPNATSTFTKESGGVLCPSQGTLSMQFTLETDKSGVNEPVWIS